MPRPYFSHGTATERLFHEDLIVEAIGIYGQEFFYIPRTLVAKDEILGEDRLSQFKTAYGIDMYLETNDGFEGQGAFIQKFGLMMEQTATLTVSRRRWEQLIGRYSDTIIPSRPCEGDLLYFPLTNGLFEIKFVKHQDPFYQLGKLFVYRLEVELFQYASEKITTGYDDINVFEGLKSFDLDIIEDGKVVEAYVSSAGFGYETPPTIFVGPNWEASIVVEVGDEVCISSRRYMVTKAGTTGTSAPSHTSKTAVNGTAELKYIGVRATIEVTLTEDAKLYRATVTNSGSGYTANPTTYPTGGGGFEAEVIAIIDNLDDQNSYGDNNKFKEEANTILFDEDNPFGELRSSGNNAIINRITAATTTTTADSTSITSDRV